MEIKNLIYTIRGKQVMLDSDLAKLYNCSNGTKTINLAVKRNVDRFPERFCFQLTQEEHTNLRFQFETSNSNKNSYGGRRYYPYVFTEQGIAMLASVLRTNVASEISVKIMDAFVEMRKFLLNSSLISERLTNVEYKLLEHDNQFDLLFNELQKDVGFKQKIFFNGQIYDAHSIIIKIIKEAKKDIIIIDNYIDVSVLDILTKKEKGVNIEIITSKKSSLSENDITKFNSQYPKIKIKYSNAFHDRFIILDNSKIYHIGASLKDAGKKCFGINLIEEKMIINQIITVLKKGYYYQDL